MAEFTRSTSLMLRTREHGKRAMTKHRLDLPCEVKAQEIADLFGVSQRMSRQTMQEFGFR